MAAFGTRWHSRPGLPAWARQPGRCPRRQRGHRDPLSRDPPRPRGACNPDALAVLCDWIDQQRQYGDSAGPWWPGYVTTGSTRPRRHRPSWCYGTAGIARAQQLAGLALRDIARQKLAENAMLAVLEDPAQRAGLPEVGLCHGRAGLLQAAWRMAVTSTDPYLAGRLHAELRGLATQLASQLVVARAASPELMDGTAGAVLALYTASAGVPVTGWDAVLCLS
ncbi:lanthionine synthetase LanC family protein [Jiangella muralis]|uniref:lanthionine synthetase LanC family protein n=1 Tax=Jiangella muralis TaxID=702383 RepID=UPI003B84943E